MPITSLSRRNFNTAGIGAVNAGTAGAAGDAPDASASSAAGVSAPTSAFTLGTQVGVPTGTTLTNVSGGTVNIGTADGTETLTLTHPITGATADRSVKVWRRKRWTSTPTFAPPVGTTWFFDECEFSVSLDNFVCIIDDDVNGTNDLMQPLCVFRRCTFDGNDTCARAFLGGYSWLIECDLNGAADGWGGGYWSVGIGNNIVAATNGDPEAHSDGFQNAGIGHTVLYHNWISAGTGPGASQAVRFGTEFSTVDDIDIYYCGIDRGGWSMQIRSNTFPNITDVSVVGCRWTLTSGFGPTDFGDDTTVTTWIDNKLVDGTVVPNPVP